MLGKDVSKLTDWNDSLREDSPYEPRLSHATTYGLKTRSNMSLFKYGVTDVSSEDSNDNILGQFVSDSVNMRTVRLFIDYDKFSNPFFKFKKQKNNSTTCKTDGMPTENTETRELKEELRFSITINPPSNKFPYNRSKPEFVSYSKLIGDKPLEPPKIVTPVEPEKVQEAPPPDPRTVIPPGTYYMYEMTQAVNNDESLDPKMSQAFKAHVVQNHQNLHELLSAVAKEKPLAVPEKPVLPADLGRSSLPDKSKLLLVLDIDETIVHVVRSNEKIPHQHSFSVRKAGFPNLEVKFNLRPWAREFLVEMKKYCHVALMTASHKSYAEQMQQFLDPKKEVLCAVFSKDHCVNYTKGRSVKNLLSFDYPLERLVLVDNFISAFALNIDNGVPILPYYEGSTDSELKKLENFVKSQLLNAADVRPILKSSFWVDLYHQITDVRQLVAKLQDSFRVETIT